MQGPEGSSRSSKVVGVNRQVGQVGRLGLKWVGSGWSGHCSKVQNRDPREWRRGRWLPPSLGINLLEGGRSESDRTPPLVGAQDVDDLGEDLRMWTARRGQECEGWRGVIYAMTEDLMPGLEGSAQGLA